MKKIKKNNFIIFKLLILYILLTSHKGLKRNCFSHLRFPPLQLHCGRHTTDGIDGARGQWRSRGDLGVVSDCD